MTTRPDPLDPLTGAAFVAGVNAASHAILTALRTGDRSQAKVWHKFEPGSLQEVAFDDGCQFAATRLLGNAEFAVQVRGADSPADSQPANP